MGILYYGDNLEILQRYLADGSVDLVYLDPPFNSAQNYNAFFQEKDGTEVASQITAFEDTWHWNIEAEAVYRQITEIKVRLQNTYGENTVHFLYGTTAKLKPEVADEEIIPVRVVGEPVSLPDAVQLAAEDKYQFQWWALGLLGARPVEQKKGADGGIDGKILFRDDPKSPKPEQILFSVKGGKLKADDVRSLGHVLTRENAAIGVLISLGEPTAGMRADAARVGFYSHKLNGMQYPKLQIITVSELLEGRTISRPSNIAAADETFKRALKAAKASGQSELGL